MEEERKTGAWTRPIKTAYVSSGLGHFPAGARSVWGIPARAIARSTALWTCVQIRTALGLALIGLFHAAPPYSGCQKYVRTFTTPASRRGRGVQAPLRSPDHVLVRIISKGVICDLVPVTMLLWSRTFCSFWPNFLVRNTALVVPNTIGKVNSV